MGTCRICGKNFGLIGGYMEEFTGERLNVCVDCIKKFRQISEEDSSMVRTIVDDLISSCNNEKTLPILKKYKVKAVADSQMKEQIAIMKKREVEKTPDIIVTACDLKEDYEVVAPVYFQLSNKGVFSSTYSRLAAEYSSKLQQLKEQGMLANRKADLGFLYGEYSVGQNDFDRAFYIAVEELKKQAARIDADAVIGMRQDIDLDTKTQGYYIYDTEKDQVIWKQVVQRKHRSAVTREMLYKQYDGRCQLCGKKLTLDDMTLDHIVPLNLGGADRLENIQIACFACNQLKKNILPEDFLNRVTNVFMYQMEKKCRHNLQWKCIKRLLKTLG